MSKLPELLIKNIESRMKSLGWNQKRLAEEAEMVPPVINRYVTGKSEPGLEAISAIARALSLQPWELLKPSDAQPTPAKPSPTVEKLVQVIADQEKELTELRAKNPLQAVPHAPNPYPNIPADIVAMLSQIHPSKLDAVRALLRGMTSGKKKGETA